MVQYGLLKIDLASSIQHNDFKILSCCCLCQPCILYGEVCCMDIPQFGYPFTQCWTFGLFTVGGYQKLSSCEDLCTDLYMSSRILTARDGKRFQIEGVHGHTGVKTGYGQGMVLLQSGGAGIQDIHLQGKGRRGSRLEPEPCISCQGSH